MRLDRRWEGREVGCWRGGKRENEEVEEMRQGREAGREGGREGTEC